MPGATLDTLAPGDTATVAGFRGEVPARLLEMGLVPGTPVEVVRLAPLGDPMELRVRGFLLTVRKAEAASIEVS
ncbi:FeoA family protein [Rubrivirga sp. IMCC45206]|uniref:FeoA family protein n=1 Tax=Rubrivirga sp. IMCC45206 TaxID=3391614 RepID=UPI003990185C